jgi:hypothetical protein
MDESAVAMPARNQALLNATLVASTAATVDLDSLYVNSVVHSIRAEGMGGAARGKLWESLHRALLGIRTSKAALQAVASAGGAALGGDVLKEETRELFHSLRDECANFGTWDNRASAAGGGEVPALSPRSALMSATSLPAIVPSPVHDNSSSNNNNSDFDRLDPSATTSEDVLNSVLGTTSPKLKRSAAVNLDQPAAARFARFGRVESLGAAECGETTSQVSGQPRAHVDRAVRPTLPRRSRRVQFADRKYSYQLEVAAARFWRVRPFERVAHQQSDVDGHPRRFDRVDAEPWEATAHGGRRPARPRRLLSGKRRA